VTHLYLIRHGESVSNVEPIVGGMRGDAGLTATGITQAERLRDRLAATGEIAADVLISSTLPRARQTAEIIAPALKLPILWNDEVQEIRPGEADGLSNADFEARYGRPDFVNDPYREFAPGGESWAQFMLRVATTLTRITREHTGKTVVIVCHGGVIDGSFQALMGLSALLMTAVEFSTRNTAITHWQHRQRGERPPRWRLVRYNDDTHLSARFLLRPADQEETHPAVPLATED
jgi:probable phosphoglycerate mutase